jgi:mannan endo-1,4-beta-mannosidase
MEAGMRSNSRLVLIAVVLCCFSLLPPSSRSAAAANTTLLGVYYGNQGWKMDQVRHMEEWQGKKHAVVNLFTNWCNRTKTMDDLFKQQLINIWNNQNVPMITWEPFLCSASQTPADVEVKAAAGTYDSYLGAWADRLKVYLSGPDGRYGTSDDRRAYLRLGHEMNGDWYPWGAAVGNNSPDDFVAMWRHVRGIFDARQLDSSRVQWVWVVNHTDNGGFTAEQYYPGDNFVDWVGIDGYNWGTSQSWSSWKSPEEVYDDMIGRLRTLAVGKPLSITEYASSTATTGGPNVAAKSQWITAVQTYVLAKDVRLVAWFNEDKEADWAVFGGSNGDSSYRSGKVVYKTYTAYQNAVLRSEFIGSNKNNPRLLTDAQFQGQ